MTSGEKSEKGEKMNFFKNAIAEKYGKDIYELIKNADSIKIAAQPKGLLSKMGSSSEYQYCDGGRENSEVFYVFSENKLYGISYQLDWSNGSGESGEETGETIIGFMFRTGITKYQLIISRIREYQSWNQQTDELHIIIYIPTGGEGDVTGYIEFLKQKAKEDLEYEIKKMSDMESVEISKETKEILHDIKIRTGEADENKIILNRLRV